MSKYVEVLNEMIQKNYPNSQDSEKIIITNIQFQILYPKTSTVLQKYLNLKTFIINNCDLRNLQNFPLLLNLEQLDLSNNQLQGTFNHLMKCKNLTYINLTNNIISEVAKLAPLKRIGNITICINDNPLCNVDGYANKIKNYNIKLTKSPKKILQEKNLTNKIGLKKQESKKKQKVSNQLCASELIQRSRSHGNDLSNLLLGSRNTIRADQLYNLNNEQRRNRLQENRYQLDRRLERMQNTDPQRVRRIRQRLLQRDEIERQRFGRQGRQSRMSNYFDRHNRYNMMNIRIGLNRTNSDEMSNIFFKPNLDLISDSLDPSSQLNENIEDNEDDEQDQLQVDENLSKSQEEQNQREEQEDEEEEEEEQEDIQNLQSQSQLNNLLEQQNRILRRRINLQINEPLFLIDRVNLSGMSDSDQVPLAPQNQDEDHPF